MCRLPRAQLDRRRRAIEFTLYNHELGDCVSRLDSLEDVRRRQEVDAQMGHVNATKTVAALREAKARDRALEERKESLQLERVSLEAQRSGLVQQLAKVGLDVTSLEERLERARHVAAGVRVGGVGGHARAWSQEWREAADGRDGDAREAHRGGGGAARAREGRGGVRGGDAWGHAAASADGEHGAVRAVRQGHALQAVQDGS